MEALLEVLGEEELNPITSVINKVTIDFLPKG